MTIEDEEESIAEGITLKMTCYACPEQYDAFFMDGIDQIAYLRLRHGEFTVECPDVDGEAVYEGTPEGDGAFDPAERDLYLHAARLAIARWLIGEKKV